MAEEAARLEASVHTDPRTACFYARRILELIVEWVYDNDADFQRPFETQLVSLLAAPCFLQHVPSAIVAKARVIRELGNRAVHGKRAVQTSDALRAVQELFHVAYWFGRTYSEEWKHEGVEFDPAKLPQPAATLRSLIQGGLPEQAVQQQTAEQLQKLEETLRAKDAELAREREEKIAASATLEAKIEAMRLEVAEAKKKAALVPDTHDYSEAQTRDFFIDLMLREAGWGLKGWTNGEDIEVEVDGMPNQQGKGYVDYVLWGDDGRPLAIVEAKRTKKDARLGQQQAKLYADCLEKQHGRRPVIYYSNGYETWIWDDALYPSRPVQGFHTKDELSLMVERRTTRLDPATEAINPAIVERYYQIEALREMGARLQGCYRKGLLVMATGSGKTRTVIALVDLLQRCSWAKRVLFLADRTALVDQAVREFKKHLPGSSPVNLVTDKSSTGRVYVSTYPTMLNLIDSMQTADGTRRFGPGHFDLVIIDEAHRSVYQKYKAIFDYFDSLLIGLTATPRDEVDRDTYRLFDLQVGLPTYSYDLETAVRDGFLVPYVPISVPLKFQREGITYDNLSEQEKEQWDALEWDETGEVPDRVEAEAINKWLFNTDTVDKVLAHLMQHGIKVAGGDRLGKTIIFAKGKEHARFIESRFNHHYPKLKGIFARVIDHYEPYAASILSDFSIPDKDPHFAISVDMLDTGVDIPEVVNLVFFKLVRSKTKFFQMIGRGTRLCPNLFGPGVDKREFYIFDFCQNLEFFSQNPAGVEGNVSKSLGQMLFERRLELHASLALLTDAPDDVGRLVAEIADTLHGEVAAMNVENFLIRPKRRSVEQFKERKAWDHLGPEQYDELAGTVAGLPSELPAEDETAKRFDLLILKLQLAVLRSDRTFETLRDQLKEIASKLQEKKDVPMVGQQMALILDVQTDGWWENVTLPMLEHVRTRLRDLIKFIDKSQRKIVFTDFDDEIGPGTVVHVGEITGAIDAAAYRRKMEQFLHQHSSHVTINKLRMNEQLTPLDLQELERLLFQNPSLGGREQFEKAYGRQDSLGLFIRGLVGLDREAAKKLFAEFLTGTRYSADQIRFVNFIIDRLTQRGVMQPEQLYEPPCTDLSPAGIDGVFKDADAERIIKLLRQVEESARPAMASGG